MTELAVRDLTADDRDAWHPLWRGYQEFYETDIPEATTDVTWARFHDPAEPMRAFGAFLGERLVGIVHVIQKCFPDRIDGWQPKLTAMVPAAGVKLGEQPKLAEKTMERTAEALEIAAR